MFVLALLCLLDVSICRQVRAYFAAAGDEVKGFGPGTRLFLQALSVTATTITNNHSGYQPQTHAITSATETVFSQSPGGRIGEVPRTICVHGRGTIAYSNAL